MAKTTCNVTPDDPWLDKDDVTPPPSKKKRFDNFKKRAINAIKRTNLEVPGLRISEMNRTPQGRAVVRDAIEEYLYSSTMAKRVTINPEAGTQMSQFIAKYFPQLLGKDDVVRKVRNYLEGQGKAGRSLLDNLSIYGSTKEGLIARVAIGPMVDNGYKNVRAAIKKAGVTVPKDTLDRLWLDAVELGAQPNMVGRLAAGKIPPAAQAALMRKRERFIQRARRAGVGDDLLQVLMDEVTEIHGAMRDFNVASQVVGLDIGDVTETGLEFMPRRFRDDARVRINRTLSDDIADGWMRDFESAHAGLKANMIDKSRSTFDFAVEDEVLLATTLGLMDDSKIAKKMDALKRRINAEEIALKDPIKKGSLPYDDTVRQRRLAQMRESLNKYTEEVREKLAPILTDEGLLNKELADLTPKQLGDLIDSGVLSKVPMLTTEVADMMIKRHGLPYSGIDELLMVDPVEAFNTAKRELSGRIGQAAMVKGMARDAFRNGWGVSKVIRDTDPRYSNFVELPPRIAELAGPDHVKGFTYHPLVIRQLQATLDLATDPLRMGQAANIWQGLWKMSKEQVLAISGFLGRQFMQLTTQAAMSGTNLALIPGAMDTFRRYQREGLDVFDNEKVFKFGDQEWTERALMERAIKEGKLDSRAGQASGGVGIGKSGEGSLNPRNLKKAVRNIKDAVIDSPTGGMGYAARLAARISNDAAYEVMSRGVWLEQAYKIAYLRTKMINGGSLSLGKVMNAAAQVVLADKGRVFNSVEDLFDDMSNVFLDYGSMGKGDEFLSKNVAPFWMYMSRSMPAVFRHMMRNPTKYVTYNRLYHLAQSHSRESGENAPEGGFPTWLQGQFGMINIPHPLSTPTSPKWVSFNMASIDTTADVLNRTDSILSAGFRAAGFFTGNTKDQLKQADPNRNKIDEFNQAALNFGPAKLLLQLARGKDDWGKPLKLRPDQEYETLLGLPLVGGEYSKYTRTVIENIFPTIANLDRWNPFEVFGLKERTNALGEVTREGKPSLWGTNRTSNDSDVDDLRGTDMGTAINIARGIGLSVTSVDVANNMQYTQKEMSTLARDLRKLHGRLVNTAEDETLSEARRQDAAKQAAIYGAMYIEVEQAKRESERWLYGRDHLTVEAQERADREALNRLKTTARAMNKQYKQARKVNDAREGVGLPTQFVPDDIDVKALELPEGYISPTKPSQVPLESAPKVFQGTLPPTLEGNTNE